MLGSNSEPLVYGNLHIVTTSYWAYDFSYLTGLKMATPVFSRVSLTPSYKWLQSPELPRYKPNKPIPIYHLVFNSIAVLY